MESKEITGKSRFMVPARSDRALYPSAEVAAAEAAARGDTVPVAGESKIRMLIERIWTTPLYLPFRRFYGRPIQSAQGELKIARYVLVQIETSDGLVGLGEVSSIFGRHGELYRHDIDTVLGPALLHQDARDIARLSAIMDAALDRAEPAKAGIEMALLDLMGKRHALPVFRLLGGKQRESVPLSFSVMYGSPEEMGGLAAELVGQGFTTLKVKVGQSLALDLRAVAAVRAAVGPDTRIRVDANACWMHLKTALQHIRALEPYDVELIEQPLPAGALEDLCKLRQLVGKPIMVDESVWSPADAWRVLAAGAADVLNVYVSESGGVLKALRIFEMARLAGVQTTIGSMPELGIGTAAQIHLGIAAPEIGFASDVCGALYFAQDIIRERLPIRDGRAFPLEAPGLGVTLDEDAVREYSRPPACQSAA
ncbi:MAG: mandelate racemase/muconate lactonizing enzyme family protein [Parvibaculaceae bacterium]